MKTKQFDPDYYGVAFSTIASLALRCQAGSDGDDILWAISELSERLASELYDLGASSGEATR
jgi:hypothetical protein